MRVLLLFICLIPVYSFAVNVYSTKAKLIEDGYVDYQELSRWKNDLLYSHLKGIWLERNIQTITRKQAETFINAPDSNAAQWFFRPAWRKELVRRQEWKIIERDFAGLGDPTLVCHYFEALQHLGKPIPSIKLEDLWMTGKSQPGHCDPFFSDWIASNDASDVLVWDRQLKGFYSRNGKLVRYLNRFYKDPELKTLGEFLSRVYNDPKQIVSQEYDPSSVQMHEIALAAVNRMAFQDPRSASNLWLQIVKATPNLTHLEIRQASRYLGIAMAKQALPEASYWLTIADAKGEDEEVQHWRLQIALADQDYRKVADMYERLSNSLKQSNQWQYWYGISQLKKDGFLANDNPLYSLSTKRLYYGYLAAGVLGKKPSLNDSNNYPPVNTRSLAEIPALKRARALYEAGEVTRAQVEWNLYVRDQSNQIQHAAAELAMEWQWYAKASQSAGWSGRYDLIDLRYPNAFESLVEKHSQELDLPAYWLYGVMRQESRYAKTAVSPAGAIGLMQVMPATARQTANKHQLPYQTSEDLKNPEVNIAIGSHYLSDLIQRFDHPVYATAAYNAGPSRVVTWKERFPNDMTIWIESIPFNETRNYVKSVLAYSQIYAILHETDWHLASWTNPVDAFASVSLQ